MTTPTANKTPVGERRLARVDFKNKPELAWYSDSLTGTPTVTPTSEVTPNGGSITISAITIVGKQVQFVIDATSAIDDGSYLIHVSCGTAGGSTLVCDCRLLTTTTPQG